MKAEFFKQGEDAYWTVFIDYEMVTNEKINLKASDDLQKSPILSEADILLLKRLKEWRKEKAEKDGIPVYLIATNAQLLAIILEKPKSKEALKQIKGFGKLKIEKYSESILKLMGEFKA